MFEHILNQGKVKITILLLFILSLSIPFLNLIQSGFGLDDISRFQAPKGQVYYLASKLFGLTAFILLWWQVITGLTTKVNSNKRQHIILGISLVSLVLLHVISFVSAVSIRSETYAFGILVPDFTSGYYKIALSIGVIALLLLFFSTVSGLLMKRQSFALRYGHKLVFLLFPLVVAHSYMIGSEIQSGLLLYILYFSVISIFIIIIIRIVKIRDKLSL